MFGPRITYDRIRENWKCENNKTTNQEIAKYLDVSLSSLEHTKDYRFNAEDLRKLCVKLDCDADYLLGHIDEKKHEIADIKIATGLSHDAISKLKQLNQGGFEEKAIIQLIEFFILNADQDAMKQYILASAFDAYSRKNKKTIEASKKMQEDISLAFSNGRDPWEMGYHLISDKILYNAKKDMVFDLMNVIEKFAMSVSAECFQNYIEKANKALELFVKELEEE